MDLIFLLRQPAFVLEKSGVPAINRGLEESSIFLVLLTPEAVQSGWVHEETNTAIALANAGDAHLYFLDVAECQLPILWQQRQSLSFRNKAYEHNLQVLLAELNRENIPVETKQTEKYIGKGPTSFVDKQTPKLKAETIAKTESIPVWLKWGGGIALALFIIIGVVNVILSIGKNGNHSFETTEAAQTASYCPRPVVEIRDIDMLTEVFAHEEISLDAMVAGSNFNYSWAAISGTFIDPNNVSTTYIAPGDVTSDTITLIVNNSCGSTSDKIGLNIIPSTTTPVFIPEATTDVKIPPQNAELGDSWQRPEDDMTMVYVPSGTFLMGSEDGDIDEQPIHEVTLDGYWIDQTEVTNQQFTQFVVDTDYVTTAEIEGVAITNTGEGEGFEDVEGADWQHPYGPDSDLSELIEHPVSLVSWEDANAYCTWAGGQLPSEAQWEYAARSAEGYKYPWGNESPTCDLLNYNESRCIGRAISVGSYSPEGDSWVGASDMAGNVLEWINDRYDDNYYVSSDANNPTGVTTRVCYGIARRQLECYCLRSALFLPSWS